MTDPLDQAIARLHEDLNRVETDRANSSGPCKTCRFARYDSLMGEYPQWQLCTHPAIARPSYEPTSGQVVQENVQQRDARRPNGLCGPTGTLHTPKDSPRSWFRRIFSLEAFQ